MESDLINDLNRQDSTASKLPRFANEEEEAKWWSGAKGRQFLKRRSGAGAAQETKGLASGLRAEPRRWRADRFAIAGAGPRKGAQDRRPQRLLKMPVHEGLRREARRQQTPLSRGVPSQLGVRIGVAAEQEIDPQSVLRSALPRVSMRQ